MADILPFRKPGKRSGSRSSGNTLCRQGHHKYRILTERQFDVKQGKLVTVSECVRCGKQKIETL